MHGRTVRAALAALMATTTMASAHAQDVVVMRRVIAPPTRAGTTPAPTPTPAGTPTPTPTPTGTGPRSYYSWQVSPWKQDAGACGTQGSETRSVTCVRTDGAVVSDSNCTVDNSGPRPITSEPTTLTDGCGYAWSAGAWNVPPAACGATAETRVVSCLRSDGSQADPSLCSGPAPSASDTTQATTGCSYAWASGQWQGAGCGTVTQTRTVLCQRSDGTPVGDASCAGAKPAATQQISDASTCGYHWQTGDFGAPTPACGATTQARTVVCQRSDGTSVDDALCPGAKPSATQAATDLSTCVYSWKAGGWSAPSTTCGDATSTQTVACVDQNGNAAPSGASCSATTAPPTSRATHETSGCSFSWQAGGFGSPQPACGATVQTRSVSCQRSDGTTVANASCDAGSQPASSQPATDYSACTFSWSTSAYGDWSTTCGDATQTRTVSCLRADGTTVDDSQCTTTRPATSQSSHQVSGCSYRWVQSGFGPVAPACGATASTQTVTCLRADGQTVDDASCTASVGPKPATSQAGTDYSTCSYSWSYAAYSDPTTTCGGATQARAASCLRSDGTTVGGVSATGSTSGDTGGCVAASGQAVVSQSSYQTSGCTFSWQPGAYGSPTPACGASSQTRSFTCMRSDGQAAQDSASCGTNTQPSSQAATDYSTCSYQWNVGQWQNNATCGNSVTQYRTVTCKRSDGTDGVADSLCTPSQGAKPATSQTITDTSSCTYSWKQTVGTWSSTCSTQATRTNTVVCQRSDGTGVADAFCDAGTKPSTGDTQGVYTSCTYTPTYGAYGTCTSNTPGSTAGTQSASIASCRRNDDKGTIVANGSCSPQSVTQSCTPPNTSDQYARQAATLVDPSAVTSQPASYTGVNNYNSSSSTVSLSVSSTLCWDGVNGKTAAASYCNSLAYGPNVYDLVQLPATYVNDLHEVTVAQSDITNTIPNNMTSGSALLGFTVASVANNGAAFKVTKDGTTSNWTFRIGTPDSPSHYRREAYIQDLTGNIPSAGGAVPFATLSTLCYDSTAKGVNYAGKCNYLPTGANVGDKASLAATFVPALHEVYLNASDVQAISPDLYNYSTSQYKTYPNSNTTNTSTSGYSSICSVGTSGQARYLQVDGSTTWKVFCGTPDSPGHYKREAFIQNWTANNASSGGAFAVTTQSTLCWDSAASSINYAGKCDYLPSGANVGDKASLNATYVPDLHEVYLNAGDVQALSPDLYAVSSSQYNTYPSSGSTNTSTAAYSSVCSAGTSGQQRYVQVDGSITWKVFCGTPDNSSHYRREAFIENWTANNSSSSGVFAVSTLSTNCYDSTAKSVNYVGKCDYLKTGANVGDKASLAATYVADLREVYLNAGDVQALSPDLYANSSSQYNVYPTSGSTNTSTTGYTSVCSVGTSGQQRYVQVDGSITWKVFCGTPDNSSHYVRAASTTGDPATYATSANQGINSAGSTSLYVAVSGIGCYDTSAKSINYVGKCNYLPAGGNGTTVGDVVAVPAVWNTSAKTVTIKNTDIQAAFPTSTTAYGNSFYNNSSYVCRATFKVGGVGYAVTCN